MRHTFTSLLTVVRRSFSGRTQGIRSCPRIAGGMSRGQSMTEMTFMVLGGVVIIVTALGGAIVLNQGMAVKQLAYQGARYAATNPGYDIPTITAFVKNAEPAALKNGNLVVTVSPDTTPRTQGTDVSVSVTYTGPAIVVPSILPLPNSISSTDTTMTQ